VDDARTGSVFRAVRIRRGLTQEQVGVAAGLSRALVSRIERGDLEGPSLRLTRRVAGVLGISLRFSPSWRGAETARLLDERHAEIEAAVVERLAAKGWLATPERSFSIWGERGSIDVFARHRAGCALLVVEVKTRLVDLQDLLSTLDRKRRLGPEIARADGWRPTATGCVLVLPEETWARHAVRRHEALFGAALPGRGLDVRRWLEDPQGDLRAVWFLLNESPGSAKRRSGGTQRVRGSKRRSRDPSVSVDEGETATRGARRGAAGSAGSA
jgi:transcriptional regulator with XRE-family HTH domain